MHSRRSLSIARVPSSPLEFADRAPASFIVPFEPHVTVMRDDKRPEKQRLQGLMRSESKREILSRGQDRDRSTRLSAWMVNEGSRRIFTIVWLFLHALVFTFGFLQYQLNDNLVTARATFHVTYAIARASALVLYLDVALILIPVCRNFISLLRRGPLNGVIPFEKSITFHKAVAWSMVFFTVVHILAHMVNFVELGMISSTTRSGQFVGFLQANFTTGPGLTGWIMTALLGVVVYFALDTQKRKSFEKFWYSHHLFVLFFLFWQFHGMFCMIKPDRPPYCSAAQIGVFWKWFLFGGSIYTYERILREVRARHRTYISKVILHPSRVVEIHIKKEKTVTRAGQWIFINCPEVSYWQWHPFTLTSAPEEDYISIHMRCVGDFTNAMARALGCEFTSDKKLDKELGAAIILPHMNRVLPRVMVDGPFGSASEDVFKFEVSVLVGAGIGVTPFASVLKSIWYRLNFPKKGARPSRLNKVYFFWICRDYDSFEWFQSLLSAIEDQDLDNYIEIHTYLTAKVKEDDINNIIAHDVGSERDAVTRLRAPTHYGRPNWDRIFQSISEKHSATEAGVFFCGPKVLGSTLHAQCNKWTSGHDDGVKFVWGKENF